MESLISMEYLMSIDSILCMLSGAVIGLVAWQFFKGWGFGLLGNLAIGLVAGLISGGVFNALDFLNVGDYADPIIAGVVGAVLCLGVAGLIRR